MSWYMHVAYIITYTYVYRSEESNHEAPLSFQGLERRLSWYKVILILALLL